MKRLVERELDLWLKSPRRKPLVLRGARQVGKTWLVRDLATRSKRDLVELNFERDPRSARAFESNHPKEILADLSLSMGRSISVERSLLFLDEIQAAPALLARLRWFMEELPALPVVAAGSLLEFTLGDYRSSMPVGRVAFLHVEPMGFPEYLLAHGRDDIASALASWSPGRPFSTTLHERALEWYRRYAMVGGMPEVVAADASGASARSCRDLQRDLVATYRADFAKYAGRMDRTVLDHVLHAVARSLGRKFVYAHVGEEVKQPQARRALELLASARLCHLVRYSAANGIPLGGESKETFRKAMLIDVGVFHALADTPAGDRFVRWQDVSPSVRGQIAEQLVGQALRLGSHRTGDGPELFYWQREGGRPGEIDYLLPPGAGATGRTAGQVVPVELKSGAAGSMKSLHQFMFDKGLPIAVRLDENPPSQMDLTVKTTQGDSVDYRLVGLPLYLASRAAELVEASGG